MKILYLLKRDPDETLSEIMDRHRSSHEVEVHDMRSDKDYDRVVELIESSEKIISW